MLVRHTSILIHLAPYSRQPRNPAQSISSAPRPNPAYFREVISRWTNTARSARSAVHAGFAHTALFRLVVVVMVAAAISPMSPSQTIHVFSFFSPARTLSSRAAGSGHGFSHWSVSLLHSQLPRVLDKAKDSVEVLRACSRDLQRGYYCSACSRRCLEV